MRLKTKLVLSITASIFVVVAALSALYIAALLHQRIEQAYASNDVVAHQVLYATRNALVTGLAGRQVNAEDPAELREAVAGALRNDPGVRAELNSVIEYSPAVYDVSIVDSNGQTMLGTNPNSVDAPAPRRANFADVNHDNAWRQFKSVFGKPQVYDITLPLTRNGQPFLAVHVGLRSTFLRAELDPLLRNGLILAAALILGAVFLSLVLSNLALRPLAVISRRLDQFQAEADDHTPHPQPQDGNEVAIVSTKIERLGQRMRNVQEVFAALKENLDQVLGSLQDGLILFTRDGRAVLVSSAAGRFLGMDRDTIHGRTVHDVFDRNDPLGRLVRDAFAARVALMQEEVHAHNRHLQVSLDFIYDDGSADANPNSLGALLTIHDVESIQRIENELQLSHRLAALGRLTSGVGHEVRNPINAIVVHVELLRGKLEAAAVAEDAQRHIEVIHTEIKRLDRVIKVLVDFSRPVELQLTDHDLRDLVREVLSLTSVEFDQHGITCSESMPEQPVIVHADKDLLKQALLNVIQNGAQAMPTGGQLRVTITNDGRFARVRVIDQGPGISPENRAKIFNLYFTTKPTGTGIGLAMTYRILQLHNGSVDVESQPGHGATFTLTLPITHAEARSRVILAEPGTAGAR
jgi:PAS domain S-box-containing protein